MAVSKYLTWYLLLVGAAQIVVGACALAWAWPLFADPPFLGNGLISEYSQVRAMLPDSPATKETLSTLRVKLDWLFNHHSEGVAVAISLGTVLFVSGLVSVLIGFRSMAALRKQRGAHA